MSDPLIDMRSREDCRENYLDGLVEAPRPTQARRSGGTGEGLSTLMVDGRCWCGAHFGHDWPGRDDGAPIHGGHREYDQRP